MNPRPTPVATLKVKVVPGASRDRIVGMLGDALKVQVSAAPQRGKANEAVVRLLAQALGIKPTAIALVGGAAQPRKTFSVSGLRPDELAARLAQVP